MITAFQLTSLLRTFSFRSIPHAFLFLWKYYSRPGFPKNKIIIQFIPLRIPRVEWFSFSLIIISFLNPSRLWTHHSSQLLGLILSNIAMAGSSTAIPAPTSTVKSRVNGSAKKEGKEPLEIKEHDFFWTYTEEPHRTRRLAIIKAHPEVRWSPCPYAPSPVFLNWFFLKEKRKWVANFLFLQCA